MRSDSLLGFSTGLCCLLSKYAELSGGCMLDGGAIEATGDEGANDGDGGVPLDVFS